MDVNAMISYVKEHLKEMNDYSFMENDYDSIVAKLVETELCYIDSLVPDESGECDYDDDAAYELILKEMNAAFPNYKMYLECLVDDYLDVSEGYLSESGEIDWE